MSKKKSTTTHDPLSPTKTKTGHACLDAVKALLKEGNGRVEVKALAAKVGGSRRVRHAVWVARYAGIKLSAVREGRVAVAYVQTTVANTPQTKSIPTGYKPYWNAQKIASQPAANKAAVVAKTKPTQTEKPVPATVTA